MVKNCWWIFATFQLDESCCHFHINSHQNCYLRYFTSTVVLAMMDVILFVSSQSLFQAKTPQTKKVIIGVGLRELVKQLISFVEFFSGIGGASTPELFRKVVDENFLFRACFATDLLERLLGWKTIRTFVDQNRVTKSLHSPIFRHIHIMENHPLVNASALEILLSTIFCIFFRFKTNIFPGIGPFD